MVVLVVGLGRISQRHGTKRRFECFKYLGTSLAIVKLQTVVTPLDGSYT